MTSDLAPRFVALLLLLSVVAPIAAAEKGTLTAAEVADATAAEASYHTALSVERRHGRDAQQFVADGVVNHSQNRVRVHVESGTSAFELRAVRTGERVYFKRGSWERWLWKPRQQSLWTSIVTTETAVDVLRNGTVLSTQATRYRGRAATRFVVEPTSAQQRHWASQFGLSAPGSETTVTIVAVNETATVRQVRIRVVGPVEGESARLLVNGTFSHYGDAGPVEVPADAADATRANSFTLFVQKLLHSEQQLHVVQPDLSGSLLHTTGLLALGASVFGFVALFLVSLVRGPR